LRGSERLHKRTREVGYTTYAALLSLFHTCFPSIFTYRSLGPRQQILWLCHRHSYYNNIIKTQTDNILAARHPPLFLSSGSRFKKSRIYTSRLDVSRPTSVSTISKGYHRIPYNSSTVQVNSCFTIHKLIKLFASIIIKSCHCAEIGLQSVEGIGILPPPSSYPVIHRISSSARFRARSRSRAKAYGYCVSHLHWYITIILSLEFHAVQVHCMIIKSSEERPV
jgi:hypothetical protein